MALARIQSDNDGVVDRLVSDGWTLQGGIYAKVADGDETYLQGFVKSKEWHTPTRGNLLIYSNGEFCEFSGYNSHEALPSDSGLEVSEGTLPGLDKESK